LGGESFAKDVFFDIREIRAGKNPLTLDWLARELSDRSANVSPARFQGLDRPKHHATSNN
jgi:hypothetical protein